MDGKEIEQIRLEYITGGETLRALAAKHGIAYGRVKAHCTRKKWTKQREEYRSDVRERVLSERAGEDTEKLLVLADSTEKAVALAAKAFEDPDQFNRYLVSEKVRYAEGEAENGDGIVQRQWTEERVFKKTDTKALKEMTAVLRDLTGLMRDFNGIPTKMEAERARIAAERLELEKQKLQRAEHVNAVEVILDAGEGDWNE